MKSLLEKMVSKLNSNYKDLEHKCKSIHKTCYHYLVNKQADVNSSLAIQHSKVGFFALVLSLSNQTNGLYQG